MFLRYLPSPCTTWKDLYCRLASGNSDWQVKWGWEGSLGVLVACATSSWASEPGWRRPGWCEVGPQHWPTPRPISTVLHCMLVQTKSWPPQKSTWVIKHRVLKIAEHFLKWLCTATGKLGNNNWKIILHTESESRKSVLDKGSTALNFHRVSSCSLTRFREIVSPCPPSTSSRTTSTPESLL